MKPCSGSVVYIMLPLSSGVDGKLITHAEADLLKAKGEHTHTQGPPSGVRS